MIRTYVNVVLPKPTSNRMTIVHVSVNVVLPKPASNRMTLFHVSVNVVLPKPVSNKMTMLHISEFHFDKHFLTFNFGKVHYVVVV